MAGEDHNLSDNFQSHNNEIPVLEQLEIEENDMNLVSKSLDTKNHIRNMLSNFTSQDGLLKSELLTSLKKIRFSDQEFAAGTSPSNIRYNHLGFQINNFF